MIYQKFFVQCSCVTSIHITKLLGFFPRLVTQDYVLYYFKMSSFIAVCNIFSLTKDINLNDFSKRLEKKKIKKHELKNSFFSG